MNIQDFYFLTTNKTKATDFRDFGFKVKEFSKEIMEVLSPYVEEVVIHKSRDTDLKNVIVEDTSLSIEGTNFFGTQIKDYWDAVELDDSLHMRKAVWEVSTCLSFDDKFYISTGKTEGVLIYPSMEQAYHFNKTFSVQHNGKFEFFGALSKEDRHDFSPRIKSIKKLKHALENEDYTNLLVIDKANVKNWNGKYQESEKKIKIKNN